MTTTQVLGALVGALLVAGALLAVDGVIRRARPPRRRRVSLRRRRVGPGSGWVRWRWPTGLVAGVLVWVVWGWPVAGAITTATVLGLPILLSTSAVAAAGIERIEAVEAWTRHLADVLVAGAGLEQAITVTARTAPAPIASEVDALTARLGAHWASEDALRAFGDDLDDATADLVVAALLLAARRRGPGLGRVLTSLADSVADEVAMRRRVEADRAKPRATARAVTLITLAVVALGAVGGDYAAPYRTPVGQVVLAVIAAGFTGCLAWMRALTLTTTTPRFLNDPSTRPPGQAVRS